MFDWLFDIVLTTGGFVKILLFIMFLIGGLFLLIRGADLFVDSASNLATRMKIPAIIVGLTIVALGTSAPEASVSISSAIMGSNGISVGNIIGSNMFNLLVVLGFASIFMPVVIDRTIAKRDVLVMVASTVLLLVFSVCFSASGDFELLRWEGMVMLVGFVAYMVYVIIDANKKAKANNSDTTEDAIAVKKQPLSVLILLLIIGLVGVVAGGEFVTFGAKNLAIEMGVSEALVGLSIVAIGTSLPEFITSIVAIKKKQTDIALGNIIGSNIFNTIFILAMSCTIMPLVLSMEVVIYTALMTIIFILFFMYSLKKDKISKTMGIVMMGVYLAYFILVLCLELL